MNKKLVSCIPDRLAKTLRAARNQRRKSLSQVGQDFWVFGEAFNGKRSGFFLELGSADGITLNNTYILEKRFGWTGICIEANPVFFKTLSAVRSARCLNCCVDSTEGEVEFFQDGLMGGIMGTDEQRPAGRSGDGVIRVKSYPLATILDRYSAPPVIDYLSVDIEGVEERVLIGFPFERYRFLALTIERPSDRLRRHLSAVGYILVKEIPGLDWFYIHSSFLEAYRDNVYDFWGHYRA
jgi:FkbM family methyltransferase